MTRNFAIAITVLVLLIVSTLFDHDGTLPAAAGAGAPPVKLASAEVTAPPLRGSFGSENDSFEESAEPEPDEGLAEDNGVPMAVQAYGVIAHIEAVPAPLRGTITNVARIE